MSSVPTEGCALARRKGFPHNFCFAKITRYHRALAVLRVGDTRSPLRLAALLNPFRLLRHVHAALHNADVQKQPQRRNTMSSVATTTIDSRKPTTKQEIITANIKLLIEQLEGGHSDALTNYLTAMSRFHNYSFGNVLEIARQKPVT
jgi:hypothetical protein